MRRRDVMVDGARYNKLVMKRMCPGVAAGQNCRMTGCTTGPTLVLLDNG